MPLPIAELEDALTRQRTSEPFSGVVSLRQADTILFERACGDALRAEAIPNRVDTRFQIASGCKIFTSVAVNQLFEQGRLDAGYLAARLRRRAASSLCSRYHRPSTAHPHLRRPRLL